MRQRNGQGRRHAWKPVLEAIESRELLSTTAFLSARRLTSALTRQQQGGIFFKATGQLGGIDSTPLSTGVDPRIIASGNGVPTPHERVRNLFQAKFAGSYDESRGRTNELATTTRLHGEGAWTRILHGSTLTVIATPKPGTTEPAVGIVELNDRNINTGQLLLRFQGLPGDASQPSPTRFSWVVDPSSSGAYTGAVGQGFAEIRYTPERPLTATGFGRGRFAMRITGTLIVTGLPL